MKLRATSDLIKSDHLDGRDANFLLVSPTLFFLFVLYAVTGHTSRKVRDFLRTPDSGGSRSLGGSTRALDFPAFVKAYAWVFFRRDGADGHDDDDNGGSDDDADDDSLSSSLNPTEARGRRRTTRNASRTGNPGSSADQTTRKLGYGSTDRPRSRSRSRGRGLTRRGTVGNGGGIGEEAELRRWEKRLGGKQMRRLERVFSEWAVDDAADDDDGGGARVEVRDLERCFGALGKVDVRSRELRAWCDEVDLAPGDTLSLADFAYAYHAMFVDAGGEGVRAKRGCWRGAVPLTLG